MKTGNIFVISAPSGAGKSSLVKALCEKDPLVKASISHTTRKMRPGEIEGVHYYFIEKNEFLRMLAHNEFLEHATVYDNYYGTHRRTIELLINSGKDIILEIDYQGAIQIRKLMQEAILIYILPPNMEVLRQRLVKRDTDEAGIIEKRLNLALDDLSYAKYFDFAIINDDFNQALDDLYSIILSHRHKTKEVLKKWCIPQSANIKSIVM
jgi:guanylate kinase